MKARFASRCPRCGDLIAIDDMIEIVNGKGVHEICPASLNLYDRAGAQSLADQLGWIRPGDPIPDDWWKMFETVKGK